MFIFDSHYHGYSIIEVGHTDLALTNNNNNDLDTFVMSHQGQYVIILVAHRGGVVFCQQI